MMGRGQWLSVVCLCLWAQLSLVTVARATPEEDEAARRHFESGRAYFERAEYDDAVREYEKSYALSLRPPLLVNISRAHESAGRPAEAAEALERWLSVSPPDDPMRTDIESRHKRLRAQADKLAQEATTQGEPEPAAAPPSERAPREGERSTLGPWLLIGGGAGALAGGAVVAVLGRGEISDVEDAKQGTRWSTVKDKADSGPRKVVIGSVVGGLGAAAAVAGVVWLLMGKPSAGETQTQVALSPEGVHVWGRF